MCNEDEAKLTELPGKKGGKITNHIDGSLPKYKSVTEKTSTYKRKDQNVTSVNSNYLIGPLAFANHSCSIHRNARITDEQINNISLVRAIEENHQITYDYGDENNFCVDCNNNK